jgi:hypothetical protein
MWALVLGLVPLHYRSGPSSRSLSQIWNWWWPRPSRELSRHLWCPWVVGVGCGTSLFCIPAVEAFHEGVGWEDGGRVSLCGLGTLSLIRCRRWSLVRPLFVFIGALHGEGDRWSGSCWVSLICAHRAPVTCGEGGLGLGRFFLCLFLAFRCFG